METPSIDSAGTITSLLNAARGGCKKSSEELWATVYPQLRAMASNTLRGGGGRVLDATSLVHEACGRLLQRDNIDANNRRHLFFILGRAMHDALVDCLRAQHAQKRGHGRVEHTFIDVAGEQTSVRVDLLDLDDALAELRTTDPDAAEVVMLRFYSGQTLEETAATLGCTFAVVRRQWEYAKAWLHERLSRSG